LYFGEREINVFDLPRMNLIVAEQTVLQYRCKVCCRAPVITTNVGKRVVWLDKAILFGNRHLRHWCGFPSVSG
jgi:hypothetical protein